MAAINPAAAVTAISTVSLAAIVILLAGCKPQASVTVRLTDSLQQLRIVADTKSPFKMSKALALHAYPVSRSDFCKFSEMISRTTPDGTAQALSENAMLLYPFNASAKSYQLQVTENKTVSLPKGCYLIYSHPNEFAEFDTGWAFWEVTKVKEKLPAVQFLHRCDGTIDHPSNRQSRSDR